MTKSDHHDRLVDAARKARARAYSPYSRVKIGAAVLTSDGEVYAGCNIENASYGLSCCAERTAIFKAVSEGARKIVAIAVVGSSEEFTSPCGACRQVMVEFNPAMKVLRRGIDGYSEDTTAGALLPGHFKPAELSKK
ncbi:MAG: cytidine deaminase [Nitrososphaerota archaeon]|nr:cytidine deaminase [Nitrososphaerota archaeon]MDG7011017.1 cytidine deaminase [Nitrososphaerota archaeon]